MNFDIIRKEFGERYIWHSCISSQGMEELFAGFLKKKKISHALEIGTYYGVSATIMALYANKVSTIDIKDRYEPKILWKCFAISNITPYVVKSEAEKADLIETLDFDFAFVDGAHGYANVRLDFAMVKKCGRVLFHDYYLPEDPFPYLDTDKDDCVKVFVDELPKEEVTIKKPFAYWEAKQQ